MSPHSKTVLRDIGVVVHVPGLMALVSMLVAWLAGEHAFLLAFFVTALVSLVPGQLLFHGFRGAERMGLRHAMVTAVLSWMAIPLIGMLPFLLSAGASVETVPPGGGHYLQSFWNALFESVSGFTSTGLTMVDRPSELPMSLQWWRSFMQWVGGVGVIVLTLTVFHPSGDAARLYFSEGHEDTSVLDVTSTVRTVWWIYLLYTVAALVLLRVVGMSWWQAINYAMTGIATGGFGITDRSLADFGVAPKLAMVLIMIAGAISFSVHRRLLTSGHFTVLWKTAEIRVLLLLLVCAGALVALENRWYGGSALWLDSVFQFASALTTSGFSTQDLNGWSPSGQLMLCLAMWCGGSSGATTGGLKLKRVLLLARGAYERIRGVVLHPWRLMEHKPMVGTAAPHSERALEAAAIMALLWAIGVLLGTALLLHAAGSEVALGNVLLEVSSALGNVGLTSGISGPDLHWSGKLALVLLMWIGRLEIIPVLVLIAALIMAARHALLPQDR